MATTRQLRAGRRLRRGLVPLTLAGSSLAVVATLVLIAGPESTLEVVRELDPVWLVVGLGVQLVGLASLGQVYRSTHHVLGGQVSYRHAAITALAAFALTQALPAGGAAGGALAARRFTQHGCSPVSALYTVFHVGVVLLGALSLLVTVGTATVAATTGDYLAHALVAGGLTVAIGLAYLCLRWLSTHPVVRRRVVALLERLRWRGRGLPAAWVTEVEGLQQPLARLPRLVRPVMWATGKWSADLVVLSVALVAAGGSLSVVAVTVSYGIANALNNVPTTPGGVGIVEGGLAGSLIAFGFDPATATVTTLAYRLLAYWLPLLIAALPASIALHRARPTRRVLEGASAAPPQVAA